MKRTEDDGDDGQGNQSAGVFGEVRLQDTAKQGFFSEPREGGDDEDIGDGAFFKEFDDEVEVSAKLLQDDPGCLGEKDNSDDQGRRESDGNGHVTPAEEHFFPKGRPQDKGQHNGQGQYAELRPQG